MTFMPGINPMPDDEKSVMLGPKLPDDSPGPSIPPDWVGVSVVPVYVPELAMAFPEMSLILDTVMVNEVPDGRKRPDISAVRREGS